MEALASLTTRHVAWPADEAAPILAALFLLLLVAVIVYRLQLGRFVRRLLGACRSRLSVGVRLPRDRRARRQQLERDVRALQEELSRLEAVMANPELQTPDTRFAEIRASLERVERQVQHIHR